MSTTTTYIIIFLLFLTISIISTYAAFLCGFSFINHLKNDGYEIVQEVQYPIVTTYVWYDGKIIKSWYDVIESDSTSIKRKDEAKRLIRMINIK